MTVGDLKKLIQNLPNSVTVNFRYYPSSPENIEMKVRRIDRIDDGLFITITPGKERGVSIPENRS